MEIIIFFIIMAAINFFINSAKSTAKTTFDPLKIRVVSDKVDNLDVFTVFASGSWNMPHGANSLVYNVKLFQRIGGSDKLPVMCVIKEWTDNSNLFFNYISGITTPGTGTIYFTSEVKLISIPVESLKLPYSGKSDLIFELNLISFGTESPYIFKTTTNSIGFNAVEQGYQDRLDGISNYHRNVVKIAGVLSAVDNDSDIFEREIIEDWLVDNSVSDNLDELLEIFDNEIYEYSDIKDGLSKIKSYVLEIKDFCSPADKINLLNLLHNLSLADDDHNEYEEKIIRYIVKNLNIEEEKYNKLLSRDVKFANAELSENKFDSILGITEEMTNTEIKNILKEQYKIWNQKITSSNVIEAKNARVILEYISERRANL